MSFPKLLHRHHGHHRQRVLNGSWEPGTSAAPTCGKRGSLSASQSGETAKDLAFQRPYKPQRTSVPLSVPIPGVLHSQPFIKPRYHLVQALDGRALRLHCLAQCADRGCEVALNSVADWINAVVLVASFSTIPSSSVSLSSTVISPSLAHSAHKAVESAGKPALSSASPVYDPPAPAGYPTRATLSVMPTFCPALPSRPLQGLPGSSQCGTHNPH